MSEKIEDLLRQMSLRRPPPELDDAIARQLADTGGDALVVAPPAERYGWGGWLATAVGCLLLGWVAGRSTAPLAAHKPPPATEALAGADFYWRPPTRAKRVGIGSGFTARDALCRTPGGNSGSRGELVTSRRGHALADVSCGDAQPKPLPADYPLTGSLR